MTEEKMIRIAGVRFRDNWKVYDFDATDVEVSLGDRVVVDSERGPGFASIVRLRTAPEPRIEEPPQRKQEKEEEIEVELSIDGEEEPAPEEQQPRRRAGGLRRVLRRATADDLAREARNREKEKEAFGVAKAMIAERDMPMKLMRVEYSFDASRATFSFFSETRVDFRELVKDLAFKLKSRIEMRQVGVRDVARMIGGFGPCGRELCCSSFLKNFEPVSIRMAKKQEMVLNPAKISGVCGRLLCCLSYEFSVYDEIKKDVAEMREAAARGKKEEEERRIAEARREAEERRTAEETRRQDERNRQQEQRRDKQKEGGQKGGRPEKQRDQQEKRQQAKPDQPQRQQQKQDKQPPKQEPQKPQEQAAQPPQDAAKAGKKKKRRFWRRKKKGQQGGGEAPGGGGGEA